MKQAIPFGNHVVFSTSCDEAVHIALELSVTDLDQALSIVDRAFEDIDAPWIEHCVRETVMQWHVAANKED